MQRLIARLLRGSIGAGLGLAVLALSGGWHGKARAEDTPELPAARIELALTPDGTLTVRGLLPVGLERGDVREAFPGARFGDALGTGAPGGDPAVWRRALEAINIALPRILRARIVLANGRLAVEGRLREGFAGRETQAALRVGLGSDWELDFALAEAPPEPHLELWVRPGRLEIEGIVPDGLSTRQALRALDAEKARKVSGAFTGGGAGDSAKWATVLNVVGRLLPAYERSEIRLMPGSLVIEGTLATGQSASTLTEWVAAALPEGWDLTLAGTETAAAPGDRRYDVATGGTARLLHGHWLPEMSFEPNPAVCDQRMAEIQRARRLAFASGRSTLSSGSGTVLNRLAAVAMTCLRGFGLRLEIGGHTDDRGSDADNRALSRARAEAVRRALAARGIPPAAVKVVGHGSTLPVASNETEDGRRRNRRITFAWSGSAG